MNSVLLTGTESRSVIALFTELCRFVKTWVQEKDTRPHAAISVVK